MGESHAAGCSVDVEDRSAVAAATCSLPVDEQADFAETETGATAEKEDVVVTSLGHGSYRVTGRPVGHELDGHVRRVDFICEVVPDSSDKLRGFRVTA